MSAILKQKLIDIANGFTKYGLWKGGVSETLSELNDVTLNNLQSNDVLTYNGNSWINDNNLQTQIDTLNSNLLYNMSISLNGVVINDNGIGEITPTLPSGKKIKQITLTYTFANVITYKIVPYISSDDKRVILFGNDVSKGKTLTGGYANVLYG